MVITIILAALALVLLVAAYVAFLREMDRATETVRIADSYRETDFSGDVEAWLRAEGY